MLAWVMTTSPEAGRAFLGRAPDSMANRNKPMKAFEARFIRIYLGSHFHENW
jgi:hypothetical protein